MFNMTCETQGITLLKALYFSINRNKKPPEAIRKSKKRAILVMQKNANKQNDLNRNYHEPLAYYKAVKKSPHGK